MYTNFTWDANSDYIFYKVELERYAEYLKKVWKTVITDVASGLDAFKINKTLGYSFYSNGNIKIDINIKNYNFVIHFYYSRISLNNTDADKLTAIVFKEISILDMLEESEKRGFNVVLNICLDNKKTNLLTNLLQNQFIRTCDAEWYALIPYFIHFGNAEVIKNWWTDIISSYDIFKIINLIRKGEDFNKFKNIVKYNPDKLDSAHQMGDMGF